MSTQTLSSPHQQRSGTISRGYTGSKRPDMPAGRLLLTAITGWTTRRVFQKIEEVIASTNLGITVHAPYGDLNLATLNDPIWRESIRQICTCIEHASKLTDRVTIHPGYLSPVGKLMPQKVWELQKEALPADRQVCC